MGLLDKLYKGGSKTERLREMIQNGAVIVDVRTRQEFMGGHVSGSKNIPLNEIQSSIGEIKKIKKPVVLCCASGMRSAQAARFLKSQGIDCENGGGWMKVNNMTA